MTHVLCFTGFGKKEFGAIFFFFFFCDCLVHGPGSLEGT